MTTIESAATTIRVPGAEYEVDEAQLFRKRAGLGAVHPHMLRAAFIMAALDAGVPLRDVQIAARHADPRTTTIYDRRRQNFDRHAAYVVVAFVAGG
jgi:integrase/recombinase XerD